MDEEAARVSGGVSGIGGSVGGSGSSPGGEREVSSLRKVLFTEHPGIPEANSGEDEAQRCLLPVNRGEHSRPRGVVHRKMSLVGKPLAYKNYRTDQRFRRMQSKMHNFLERPRGWKAASYHLAVLVMVLMCLALSVFSTMPDFEKNATLILYYIEIVFVIWLGIEYVCRVWSAGCRSRYRGIAGRIRFATSAYCIIDIIVIVASIIVLVIGATGQVFAASAIRGLRFFQILRMLRIDRRAGTWKLLGSVVWAHRQELLTTLYIGFLGLIFSSFLVYLCEKNTNDKYSTFADALWWGVITLSTVGYGDKTPETWPGKIIGAFCALLGISFFALPAGILGSGFALKVQQHQRQKHLIRRRVPAARLIQCLWRHYSAATESCSVATWKVHLAPAPSPPIIKTPQGNGGPNSLISRIRQSTKKKTNTSLPNSTPVTNNVASLPVMKTLLVPKPSDNISIVSTSDISELESLGTLGFSLGNWRSKSKRDTRKTVDDSSLHTRVATSASLGNMDIGASKEEAAMRRHRRSLSLCRYLAEDREVIGDYSLMVAPLYEWCEKLRKRNNQTSGPVWSQFTTCAPRRSTDSISDDEYPSIQPRTMDEYTPVLKNTIRAIRRIQLMVARRKFKEALKPYDVKDVIEQYSAGHVDLQSRVKVVQQKLDLIVGKTCDKTEAKLPLSHRVIHVERQIEQIDKKMDMLLELFLEERRMRTGGDYGRKSPPHSAHARLDSSAMDAKSLSLRNRNYSADEAAAKIARARMPELPLRSLQKTAPSQDTLDMFTARSRSDATSESSPLLRTDVTIDVDEDESDEDDLRPIT
ncbi:unnamed protein product, partial [Mesorhabditis belari]|uniref:Uncharacterized protein n=1 Tax=Mesorhabditis belari TaxID=2138241 RepID=A0AAF3ETH0_9BILA